MSGAEPIDKEKQVEIEGRVAIVTGGGTGVGRATAVQLAARGCHVVVNYSRSRAEAEQTAAEIEAQGGRALPVQADVAEDADCRALVRSALDAFGRLDILVNNAGTTAFIPHDDFEAVAQEDWQRIFQTNVVGVFQCVRAAREALLASGNGEIVNVSSVAGIAATGSSIPYCASKAALNNLTVSLARVLAPKVRVNAVAPGLITTRWLVRGLGEDYPAAVERAEQSALLGRVCTPEDVATYIVHLITGPDLITGQILPIEGGVLTGHGGGLRRR